MERAGCHVSLSVPIEMTMRHGTPPIVKALSLGYSAFAVERSGMHHDGVHVRADAVGLLDANHINVAPLNHVSEAVVTTMERANVDTVLVAGEVRKWRGSLPDVDIAKLTTELEASRDYIFKAAGVPRDLYRV